MNTTKAIQNRSIAFNAIRRTLFAAAILSLSAGAFANLKTNPYAGGKDNYRERIGYDYCMATIGGENATGHGTSGVGGVGVGGIDAGTVPAKDPVKSSTSSGRSSDTRPDVGFGSPAQWPMTGKAKPPSVAFCHVDRKTNKRVCSQPL